ncbi:MAG TPA: hypothetical protein VJ869_04545, partial [Sphaerochaeta sp.]|nr:hypothetical protein [Sphaerochaeta sp.]
MDTKSKLIIDALMQENLELKALLHKSGIIFEETEKTKISMQDYEKPENQQPEQNLGHNPVKNDTSTEPKRKTPTPLDDKSPLVSQKALSSNRVLSAEERITVFASLFKGRNMYARRWQSAKTGKAGYSPACRKEGVYGVCDKRKAKCSDCKHRDLIPLTHSVLKEHLLGNITLGVYPLLDDNTCYFLACDFDKE